ncbi:conserved hypothetical protein [Ricinus communis]|uniref:Uncharacterized protein n=1 Tax=Ricinus communis TaxID=3988 RepID=B9RN32_RICCO|nr:conserved hypothetical protein [Ricinus communis]
MNMISLAENSFLAYMIIAEASHKKLLMKVEEAVETQLNGAERRITAVNKAISEAKNDPNWTSYSRVSE